MAEIKSNKNIGQIQIADDVLAVIAGTAALEVEGVYASHSVNLQEVSSKHAKKNFTRGVRINTEGDSVSVEISIVVRFGSKIHDVSVEVQSRIKNALETMVGMNVREVNVSIVGIEFGAQKRHLQKQAQRPMPPRQRNN